MGRSPCCDESGLKKGPWTPEEDQKLVKHIQKHGHGSWRALPKLAGLNRCGKSCRLRWTNYLRPDIKRGKFSQDEEQTILNLHSILGNKWSAIASHLPGRTDNEIKNFWNTHLKKKLLQMGFDPMTHRPRTDIFSSLPHLMALANLKELIDHHQYPPSLQDDAVLRSLQATEAAQMATLQYYLQYLLQPQPDQSSIPTATNNMNLESFNLLLSSLSSIKDSTSGSLTLPHLELLSSSTTTSTTTALLDHDLQVLLNNIGSIPFPHLPDLLQFPSGNINQIPQTNKEVSVVQPPDYKGLSTHEGDYNGHSPNSTTWFPSSTPSPDPSVLPPLVTENTSSGSSYGGDDHAPSGWPMDLLLEDPLFHEIA